jgi:ribosomal protein S18 acetylase RimI-like enzyme
MAIPTADTTAIRKASAGDAPRIGTTLGRAFFDDPVFRWTFPDAQRRAAALPAFFSLFAETLQRYDENYVTADGTGAALWVPPGQAPVPEEHAEQFGQRLEEIAGADAERTFAISEVIEEHHPSDPCYFLQFVGVEPDSRGRGIGSTLLAHVIARCDREGVRACLDATSPHNKRLYERHGFCVSAEYALPGGPPLWSMWRDPDPSA